LMNSNYDKPVNIGNPDEYSIKNFAEKIKDMTKSKSNIIYLSKVVDDPSQRQADISTAKKELGWQPKVSVYDGIKMAIGYFQAAIEVAGEIVPTGPEASKPKGKPSSLNPG